MRRVHLTTLLFLVAARGLPVAAEPAQTSAVTLAPLVVTATRSPRDAATLPLTVDVLSADALRSAPALSLDDKLRRSAAFSLFRRSGSGTANPTAQGVSLRGLGPSGASRSLVLLDGVPLNDPFGGWVAWTKLPLASLDRVEIVRGGGSPAWGGSSLGGVVHLLSEPLFPGADPSDEAGGRAARSVSGAAVLGDFRSRGVGVAATVAPAAGRDAFRIDAATFATEGVRLVREPGLIDRPAGLETSRGQLTWARRINPTTTLTSAVRAWREERGNGTPYQENSSDEVFVSVSLAGTPAGAALFSTWSLSSYFAEQDYRSTFSAVNAGRTAETPALDQYAVPATAAGFSAQFTLGDVADPEAALTTLGFDARQVEGETREFFFYDGSRSDFLRERRAGGVQTVGGVFVTHARSLRPDVTLMLGARVDSTRRSGGFRRETLRASSAVLLDEKYAERRDVAWSPSAGLAWAVSEDLTWRAAAYSAFRDPTLNELHRPFRVGSVSTRANPELEPESLVGGEVGLVRNAPSARHGVRATVFVNELSDPVANVSLDASTRQRRNLERVRVRGLELGAHWAPGPSSDWRLDIDYLLSDARVREGGRSAAELAGRRLAQVPRHTVSAGAVWRASRALELDLRARWSSEQFEDDLNTLPLARALRLDLAAHHDLGRGLRLSVAVENLLDEEIETSRAADGLVGLAPPRLARVELGWAW
jgi:outer membrane receptor protein involved in Fe transport